MHFSYFNITIEFYGTGEIIVGIARNFRSEFYVSFDKAKIDVADVVDVTRADGVGSNNNDLFPEAKIDLSHTPQHSSRLY